MDFVHLFNDVSLERAERTQGSCNPENTVEAVWDLGVAQLPAANAQANLLVELSRRNRVAQLRESACEKRWSTQRVDFNHPTSKSTLNIQQMVVYPRERLVLKLCTHRMFWKATLHTHNQPGQTCHVPQLRSFFLRPCVRYQAPRTSASRESWSGCRRGSAPESEP